MNESAVSENVRLNIRRLMDDAGLKPRELAEKAGLSSVRMILGGHRHGSPDTLGKIAKALRVSVSDLYAEPRPATRRHKALSR